MSKQRILVVDDSCTARATIGLSLQGYPYEVIIAENGQQGIRKALEHCPDLILMDLVMPDMTGFEAVAELRQTQATNAIPVIMLTAQAEIENIERGYALGCCDYVLKPFVAQELVAKIQDLIGS